MKQQMEVIMFTKLALWAVLISTVGAYATPRIVAWDIHQVLCTKPIGLGHNCTPNKDTFKLVEELHAMGVRQVILSNISNRSYEKLTLLYPEYFSYFDRDGSLADAHFLLTRKPYGKYYNKFMQRHPALDPCEILFFDDKPENIKGARAFGIDGQLFCNAAQARTILKRKGLLL